MSYNLFVGRWAPFHSGHKYIIDSYVNNGKKVCIAVRDTELSVKDPFSAELRKEIIEKVYKDNPLVKVIIIPDVESVVVGREVGYVISEAPEEIQRISGTEVREHALVKFNEGRGKCFWLFGLPAAGKTTLAVEVVETLREEGYVVEHLDGDNFRRTYTQGLGFSAEDRRKNLTAAARVASTLAGMGVFVIASFITPYDQVRKTVQKIVGETFNSVYVRCSLEVCEERDPKGLWAKARAGKLDFFTGVSDVFEEPTETDLVIDTEQHGLAACVDTLLKFVKDRI